MGGIHRHHRPNAGGRRHARRAHNLDRRTTATTGPWPRPAPVERTNQPVLHGRAHSRFNTDAARHHRPRDDIRSEGRRDHHVLRWTEVPTEWASRSTSTRAGVHKRVRVRGRPRRLEGGGTFRRNASRAGTGGLTPRGRPFDYACGPPVCRARRWGRLNRAKFQADEAQVTLWIMNASRSLHPTLNTTDVARS
jgi:hypothetical protein